MGLEVSRTECKRGQKAKKKEGCRRTREEKGPAVQARHGMCDLGYVWKLQKNV